MTPSRRTAGTTSVARHEQAMRRAYTSPHGYHGPDSSRRYREQRADPRPHHTSLARCAVEGCDRSDYYARGLCSKHYKQWWRHGHEHIGLPFCPALRPRSRPPAPLSEEILAECRAAYRAFVEEVGE